MNDLTNLPPSPATWPELSPGLRSLVELGPDNGSAQEIVRSPRMLAEARQALHAIRCCATQPAGEEGVQQVVGRRLVTYPQARMGDGEWAAWWQDYYDACADLTTEALEAGMAAWVRNPTSQFMPKPGQLRELAQQTPNRAVRAYTRITDALRLADRPPVEELPARTGPLPEPEPRPTREEVATMLAAYRAQQTARKADLPDTSMRANYGRTDERGLTPQMRAILAARQPADLSE